MAAAVGPDVSRDFTVFQFDVDEDAVRRLLSAIPGVTPLASDEPDASDDARRPPGGESATAGDDAVGGTTGAGPGDANEAVADAAGVEAHLGDSASTSSERPSARKWTGPSTPWPGAPTDEPDDGGLLDRLRSKRALLAGAAVALLGAVSAAAVWYLKFRGDDGGSGGQDHRGRVRAGGADSGAADREPHADDSDSRSYPVDASPVIGMAFLAIGTVVLRRFRGGDES